MSGLAVRSYVKWAVDPNSFQKAQAQYNGHLARLQKDGVASTNKTNKQIIAQHKTFVQQMDDIQKGANQRLRRRTKQIAAEVARGAKLAQAQAAGYTGTALTKGGELDKRYKVDAAAYEASLKRMEAANKGFVSRTRALGHTLQTGRQVDLAGFGALGAGDRADVIEMQRLHVNSIGKTNKGYQSNLAILNQINAVNRRNLTAERERDGVIRKTNMMKNLSLKIIT